MTESNAGSLIGILMCPVVLLVLYVTVKGAATGPPDRFGMTGIRTKATRRSDAAWTAAHRAALPVTRRALIVVLLVDVGCLALLILGPEWLKPVLGVAPSVAMLLALIPIVRTATTAANDA